MFDRNKLEVFFHPKRVVLLGTASRKLPVGMTKPTLYRRVMENVSRYHGTIIINAEMEGWEHKLKGDEDDLVVVPTIPENFLNIMELLISKGFKNFVILPGDLTSKEKKRLKELASESGIRILGPNSIFGVIDTTSGLNTTFEGGLSFKRGGSSFLFQSGGIGAAVIDQVLFYRVGMRRMAFLGNRLTVDEFQMLEHLFSDNETRAIGMYTEGMKLSEERIAFLKDAVKKKPLIVLKGGRSEAGKKRALLHTDSLSSDDNVLFGILRGVGAVPVNSVE
ncbi:MAG: hypothetical protein J7L88_06505, partial [Thermoplasmata archaeon]|nr:hypothetical protein [Thermoplasmata archaeon]